METVAEIIGDEPHVDAPAERIEAPRLDGQPEFPEPGIYFGMPDEEYHAIHACSSSGLKNLSVSSMDYWAQSVLNPEKQEEEAKGDGQLTPRQLGSAYHTYICEGQSAFEQRYAVALDKEMTSYDCEVRQVPFCVTIADIRAAIDAEDVKPKGTAKDALTDQLLELRPDAVVWDRAVAAHADAHAGKLMITPKLFRRIAIAKAMIDGDPQLKTAFSGGHAEVSIFWYDEQTGVPMKARLDYVKMNHLIDLKSFGNKMGKPIQRAIDYAITTNKYFLPVVVYLEAIEAAKKMVREERSGCIYQYKTHVEKGEDGISRLVYTKARPSDGLVKWCWDWAHQPQPEVLFIFQQTGIAPVTRGRIMPLGSHYTVTSYAAKMLKAKWGHCAKTYGTDPWVDFEPVVATDDMGIPDWASDYGDFDG